MAYKVRTAPFRYSGAKEVDDCRTAEDVMVKAHLDWEVRKCELLARMPAKPTDAGTKTGFIYGGEVYRQCPKAYGIYREDYNVPLGIVGEKYTPVQNIDAFKFFDDAIGKNKAIWQTAGYFGNGERIFVSAKLPKNIFVNGDVTENYLVFTTSHDGTSGVKILFTPIRVVCQNTLNAAIRESTNYVSFKHTRSVKHNIDMAAELLGICDKKIEVLSQAYNEMSKMTITDNEAMEVFAHTVLNDDEIQNIHDTGHNVRQIVLRDVRAINDAGISMKKVNVLSEMNNYYFTGPGQKEIVGTPWGAYNAVTGYYSNVDNSDGIRRMDSLIFGDKARKIEKAGNLIF